MGYPILLAVGAAVSAAGAGVQEAGVAQSNRAMNNTINDELTQQAEYQKQGQQVFQQSLQQSSPQSTQQQMQQGQQLAQNQYQKLEAAPLSTGNAPFQSGAPSYQAEVQGRTQNSNASQAALQGYSEWDLQQAIKDLSANSQLGIINRNAAGAASILPYQMQQASHAGDALSGVGSLLGSAGGLVGLYGATSGLGAAATAPVNAGQYGSLGLTTPGTFNPYSIPLYGSMGGY